MCYYVEIDRSAYSFLTFAQIYQHILIKNLFKK